MGSTKKGGGASGIGGKDAKQGIYSPPIMYQDGGFCSYLDFITIVVSGVRGSVAGCCGRHNHAHLGLRLGYRG